MTTFVSKGTFNNKFEYGVYCSDKGAPLSFRVPRYTSLVSNMSLSHGKAVLLLALQSTYTTGDKDNRSIVPVNMADIDLPAFLRSLGIVSTHVKLAGNIDAYILSAITDNDMQAKYDRDMVEYNTALALYNAQTFEQCKDDIISGIKRVNNTDNDIVINSLLTGLDHNTLMTVYRSKFDLVKPTEPTKKDNTVYTAIVRCNATGHTVLSYSNSVLNAVTRGLMVLGLKYIDMTIDQQREYVKQLLKTANIIDGDNTGDVDTDNTGDVDTDNTGDNTGDVDTDNTGDVDTDNAVTLDKLT